MHRQAMLVSLSLSPASTAAKNDKHWAFLEEIDAPQWADLKVEEVLAKAGTIGDDPWFYRSHSHHEVPLTEITGSHPADTKDSNESARTPQLERKKNRGSSKAKLAFDGATVAKSKDSARDVRHDESPRAENSAICLDTFGESPRDRIASPVHCKSPEKFLSGRRFMSSATSDDYFAGNDETGVLGSSNLRVNMFENQYVNEQMSAELDVPVLSTSSAGQSARECEDEDRPAQPSVPWLETIFPRLNDTSRLRKSLGSALRVKIDDSADNPCTKRLGAATLPKSRLVRQSVQLEAAVLPVVSDCDRETTFLKKDTTPPRKENDVANCQLDGVRSADGGSDTGLVNKLGVNSSVQAFDDIRKMRKSWGSALRVKVGDDFSVEDFSSKHYVSEVPSVSDAKGNCTLVKPDEMIVDLLSSVDIKAIRTGSEEKKSSGNKLPAVVRPNERRAHNPPERRDVQDLVKELEVSSPKVIAAGAAKKYRRSVSFDHTPGRGPDNKTSTSFRSTSVQQKQGLRASASVRPNGPAEKLDKVSRLSKGGKENTSLHSSIKTRLISESSVGSPRMCRQSVARMSMPSLTSAAHARAAMGANGGTILKPSSNSVLETNRSDSTSKVAVSAAKKSAGGLDSGSRKKTVACPATATNPPSKMVTRQSILRSSAPVFSAASIKHASKPGSETGAALKHGAKNGSKIGNGDADLAALLAEHNRKFRPKPKYEPRIHSVKDIREWEARTGQLFYNLLPAERERANQEMSAAKQTRPKYVPC